MNAIADIRKDYKLLSLDEKDVQALPIAQFAQWWQQATESKIDEVNALTLCTVTPEGRPQGRIVLLKGFDEMGFTFFTNYQSNKGQQMAAHHFATAVFFWKELERQVRISGTIEKLTAEESDEYFNSRPQGSRLGAWASPQSQVIANRQVLEQNLHEVEEKFRDNVIPRPEHWGGYRLRPETVEFWQGRPSRLHDRVLYTLENDSWKIERLAP